MRLGRGHLIIVRRAGFIAAALALSACMSGNWELDNKPGVTAAQYRADSGFCDEESRKSDPTLPSPVQPTASFAGNMAVSAAGGAARGVSEVIAQHQFEQACMAALGYRKVAIGEARTARLKAMPSADRRRELAQIAGEDFGTGAAAPAAEQAPTDATGALGEGNEGQ